MLKNVTQSSHEDIKYSIEKIVSNIVITRRGVRGELDSLGDELVNYINVSLLTMLYT